MEKPLIAASTYLNSAPLCYSFTQGAQRDRCHFIPHTAPSTCTELLREGEVDAALIPTIDYQRVEGLLVVPNVAVTASREVRSVLLVSRKPLEDIGSVALDTSSRTAAALTRILFEHFYRRSVRYIPWQPNLNEMLTVADAALLIGDPALIVRFCRTDLEIYDYARLWKELTGKPCVFAFWAVRGDRSARVASVDFELAKVEGIEHTDEIIEHYSRTLNLPQDFLRDYLAHCVTFDLDQEESVGLELFYELACRVGIIKDVKPLAFFQTFI